MARYGLIVVGAADDQALAAALAPFQNRREAHMAFMKQEITGLIRWLVVDGDYGLTDIPLDVVFNHPENAEALVEGINETGDFSVVADHYEGGQEGIRSVKLIYGFGCRSSAPGYLDCTEWDVFPTLEECIEHLNKIYLENNG